ncbi:patatin-like phospholipase family protein [Crenobacter sp. SG2303]|uniref:Patatin-like phospholipase family protein n=1 Tax=Crenobacter oryzisoli TaxID=3056844 RepID=A0ABT7XPY5_9NEIS|nr:patatin-like phospholipase family protein [Crenobacter sp. SG2303]MDN0075800.1 patatin-like phospholipase family protein [Crenobacter sp. SG2303]
MTGRTRIGLVMAGGGARAAYQAGVLLAVAKLLPAGVGNPFSIICGSSAGAINAAGLACGAEEFSRTAIYLSKVWQQLHVPMIYRADLGYFVRRTLYWGLSFVSGGLGPYNPRSLLDNDPLRELLGKTVRFEQLGLAIANGALDALGVTASCYSTGRSVTFFEGRPELEGWQRQLRDGMRTRLTLEHLLATSAIPLLFPAQRIGQHYYCDGAIRQLAPLSPALHLGAQKLFVISLAGAHLPVPRNGDGRYPSLAQVFGHLLSSVFFDGMESDIERLSRVNQTVSLLSSTLLAQHATPLHRVEVFTLAPSRPLEEIAREHIHSFPAPLRFLLSGTGATHARGLALSTYLLFEPGYCHALVELGYRDALARREAIRAFLELPGSTPATELAD